MAEMRVRAEGPIAAPAEQVYRYIADYQEHHHRFLPPAFSDFQVERGGVGAGTMIRFRLSAGGRSRAYRMQVAEPAPGRVLTESDTDSSLVTTFTVTPDGDRSRVRIETAWRGRAGSAASSSACSRPACSAGCTPTSSTVLTTTRASRQGPDPSSPSTDCLATELQSPALHRLLPTCAASP